LAVCTDISQTMKPELPVRIFLILFCSVLACPSAKAVDPDRRISQYAHTAWRVRDGAFAGAPTAIAQTTDGYIWIGTLAGLLRFDGVRFVPFVPPTGKHLPSPAVISLLGATDGSLWIGTAHGLAQWKNGDLINFPAIAHRVNSIYEDREGTIWIARSRTTLGGVCKVSASVATCYGPKDGAPPYAGTLIGDNLGYFLIGGETALIRWKPGSSASYELPGLKSSAGLAGIVSLAAAPDGSVWVGIEQPGHGLGLEQWVNRSWKTLITPTLDSSRLHVINLRLDRHNSLWIATDGTGIYRVHDGNVDHFGAADGLSSDTAENLFEDREGNLWAITSGGLDCFRDIPVVSFSVREGLTNDWVESILATHDGTVWIGNHGGLDLVRGNVVSSIGPKNGFRGNRVTSLFEDHAGRLWVGLDNGLLICEQGRFTPVHYADGRPVGIVVAMTEDMDNNVWAAAIRPPGRPTKLICFRDGRFVKEISDRRLDVSSLAADPQSGLWLGVDGGLARYRNDQAQIFPFEHANAEVDQILAESDGSVLAATSDGLVERRGDSQHILDGKNGLPCNRIFAIVTDKHSDFWLYAECGLIEIKSADVQRWREHPDIKVKFDLFDAFDGALPYLPPFSPIATRSNDGRLWFANDSMAQMIEPDRMLRNPIPPPVHIEDVIADRKRYSPQDGLHLPALTRDLEIDYTGLSFVVPQKVRFRYKLEGYDRDWQDPQTRRQAFYSNLRPGNYRFHVIASNNSGVWNEAGAELDFNIPPAYYQTIWFRGLCVLAFFTLLWAGYQMRVRQLQEQEKKFRDAVETMPALAFVLDPEGNRTFFNRGWLEYTGLSSEQASGSGWQVAVHPDDLKRVTERWGASNTTGQPLDYEARLRRGLDDAYRWFLIRAVPVRDKHGKIVKWCGAATDIEDRKDAEQLRADLTHASRVSTMGELVASISHELAQPITATTNNAKASLRWLQRDPPDLTQVRKGTESIIEASTFASEIINRLRSLYKKASPKRELVATNQVVGEMAAMLRSEASRHGVSIHTDLKDDLPMTVADRVQMQQVLMNLMLNGIEAMKDTGGVLTVKSQLGEDGQIEIAVKDTGPGLPLGKADQIFDAFFTTKPQGSGMGLAISKSIVESHGGRIWADGDGGRGATFHFTLPAAPVETNPAMDGA
jgi:PAS domain S-box-containing protein